MVERSSKRQKELLSFVDTFIQGHGYGPSYREIMRALGYKSVSTVAVHIDGLIAKGYLNKRDNSARSLEVITTNVIDDSVRRASTPSQEKFIVSAINDKFEILENEHSAEILDELYVLIGALKILGIENAHVAMKTKLVNLVNVLCSC
jgi:repressor LexA